MAIDGNHISTILLEDSIKDDAPSIVKFLKEIGIEIVMLSGDNQATADEIAREIGISEVYAGVPPDEKAELVSKIKERGVVAMVGDGINDAIALTTADIGVAMGQGTDVAIASSDLVLLRQEFLDIAKAIELSQQTIKNIKKNLFWAFVYNLVSLPIACGLLYLYFGEKGLLNPWIGSLTMALSSISVVTNAVRITKHPLKQSNKA